MSRRWLKVVHDTHEVGIRLLWNEWHYCPIDLFTPKLALQQLIAHFLEIQTFLSLISSDFIIPAAL